MMIIYLFIFKRMCVKHILIQWLVFLFWKIFIYLAESGLSCIMRDLLLRHTGSVVEAQRYVEF